MLAVFKTHYKAQSKQYSIGRKMGTQIHGTELRPLRYVSKYFSPKKPKTYSGERKPSSVNGAGKIRRPHAKA